MAQSRCFQIHSSDNVATMRDDAHPGQVKVMGQSTIASVEVLEPVQVGHKIAMRDIEAGQMIIKFGVPIGAATCAIRAGQWVHLHNCKSGVDARSSTLDLHSGAATDTRYE
jgi:altronate hydrolase/altronate dehydratase small subunit